MGRPLELGAVPAAADTDRILEVMEGELRRSLGGLAIPGSPRPYHLGYTLWRTDALRLRAAYGSLARASEHRAARLFADVRVGSHRFDNIVDGGLDVCADDRESADWLDAPADLDPTALQVALWKLTQIRFDEALQDYYDHRKALVSEYLRDETDSLSHERPTLHSEPLHHDPFPRAAWESVLSDLSRRFLDHPDVYDPSIGLSIERVHRWLVRSDGTRVITEDIYAELDVGGWILTEDGVYVEASRPVYARSVEDLPTRDALEGVVDDVLADLSSLREADTPGSFIGPALLAGQPAATLFHEALGHRLEGERLAARGETRTFAQKIGEQILPAGIHVYDDPTIDRFEDRGVWGSYRVDDQGVPAQRAVLVEDGRLCGFLQSRKPTASSPRSNGHGRHDGVQPPMARMANLVVEADPVRAQTRLELERELIAVAKSQGRRHALVIERVTGGETTTQAYDFQVFKGEPAEVYLVDVESLERRRIRDVELIGTPLAALQRVVAFGGKPELDEGYCHGESGALPVSGIAPAMLLSELELQQSSTTGFHEPLLPPPFADDGSRGRTGRLRQRGRRRRAKGRG